VLVVPRLHVSCGVDAFWGLGSREFVAHISLVWGSQAGAGGAAGWWPVWRTALLIFCASYEWADDKGRVLAVALSLSLSLSAIEIADVLRFRVAGAAHNVYSGSRGPVPQINSHDRSAFVE
jgi:hypothetical protein